MSHSPDAPIRLGVVGAGAIARAEHLPRFRRIPGVELAGVANASPASSSAVAAAEGIGRAYDSWAELVADPAIDAILVATRPDLHAPVAIAAVEAGKHTLVEARMSATLDEARAMVAAGRAHPDRVLALVPGSFSQWADRAIARLLADGDLGTVRHARVVWAAAGSVAPSEWWRWQRRTSGVNVMAMGILIEAMERWLGPVEAVAGVRRLLQPRKPGPDEPIETDIPDHVLVAAEFGEVTASLEMSVLPIPGGTRIELVGDRATLVVDLAASALTLIEAGGERRDVAIQPDDRLQWTAELDFVGAIRGGDGGTLTDLATGFRYMAAVDAIDRALASGRRVLVPTA